ncbi:YadA-like family protein [Vibrio sp. SCSIO 43140]|uniref:YadA-like family protein n=1 Tax=Vibrio sp. SCSIO 43140 TaxID=2819100 RepID=UPI00207620A2|nr:YadA-like family protein [Vibrio sp. SCSIO 43140]USD63762.1 YadA-like family protein [Vibrio sp. SCSIO 43140]
MKKTFIALSLASVFTAPAMAVETIKVRDIEAATKDWKVVEVDGEYRVQDANYNYIGTALEGDGYITMTNEKDRTGLRINQKTGKGEVWSDKEGWIENIQIKEDRHAPVDPTKPDVVNPVNPVKPDDRNGNNGSNVAPSYAGKVKASDLVKLKEQGIETHVDAKGNAVLVKDGKTVAVAVKNGKGEYQVVNANSGERVRVDFENDIHTPVKPDTPNNGKKPIYIIDPENKNGNGGSEIGGATHNVVKTSDLAKLEKEGYTFDVDAKGNAKILDKDGNVAGVVNKTGTGAYSFVDARTGERGGFIFQDDSKTPVPAPKPINAWERIAKDLDITPEREGGERLRINAGEYTGTTINTRNGRIEDKFGKHIADIDENGNVKPVDRNGNNGERIDVTNPTVDQAKDYVDTRISAAYSQAIEQGQKAYNEMGEEVAFNREVAHGNNQMIIDNTDRIKGHEAVAVEAKGVIEAEFAKVRNEIKSNNSNGSMDIEVNEEVESAVAEAASRIESNTKRSVNAEAKVVAAEKQYNKDVDTLTAQLSAMQAQIDDLKKNGGSNGGSTNDVEEGKVNAEDIASNRAAIEEIYKAGDEAGKWASRVADGAYTELDTKIAGNSARIGENSKRIDNLESEMKAMGDNMLVLEDRMDGVVASSHAINNARPVLATAGQFGVGVGMGAAGSKKALALGGAYQFNDSWSGSMTVNYETSGKKSKSQVSAGAGVQYRW